MSFRSILAVLALCALVAATACGKQKTPDSLMNAYVELLAEVECGPIDEAIIKLEEFRRLHSTYSLSVNVAEKLADLRELSSHLQQVRALTEQENYLQAETYCDYLAKKFTAEPVDCLCTDIFMVQAKKLLVKKRYDNVLALLRVASSRKLTVKQKREQQRFIDVVLNARSAQTVELARADRIKREQAQAELRKRELEKKRRDAAPKCAYCGEPAIGFCPMRQLWVCESHRYFTQNGQNWQCP